MAMKNRNVIHDMENREWRILERDTKGDEHVKDTVPDVEPMGEVEALQVFQGLVKEETNARRAALSMLCHIFLCAQKPENKINLGQHIGKGDLKTGQLGTGIKEDFRKSEDAYFDQWADPQHPQWRRREQGRHVRGGRRRAPSSDPDVRRRPVVHVRPRDA
jgi:hypothetical protein